MLRGALRVEEKRHGMQHKITGVTMYRLASVLQDQDKLDEAEELFQRVLPIYEKAYGPDHSDTVEVMNNLALVLTEKRSFNDASDMFRRVLRIDDKKLGPGHHDTAVTIANLARALKGMGQLDEAGDLFSRALSIAEKGGSWEDKYLIYLRGCVGGVEVLKSQRSDEVSTNAVAGRAACEKAIMLLTTPPHSLPNTNKYVKRLLEYRANRAYQHAQKKKREVVIVDDEQATET